MRITFIAAGIISLLMLSQQNSFSQCWSEVFADEFNGSSVDLSKWTYDLGDGCGIGLCGWGNNEKQSYTNSSQNVSVSGGYLNITARYAPGTTASADFTSGKLHTRDKHSWAYGKFEARMQLPAGTGVWPAFWMLPQAPNPYGGWPTSGEIDIMEFRGDITNRSSGTLHYGPAYPNNQWDGTDYVLSTGNFTNSFHVFAVEWEPNQIRWYVDGILFKTENKTPNSLNPANASGVAWPWDQDFYMLLNLAIGGWFTGNPSTATIIGGDVNWNRTMLVDYVRVYTDLAGGGLSGAVSGKSSVLQNETNLTYSIPATGGASYSWTTPAGTTVNSGTGTESINMDWHTSDGVVSVVKNIGCGSANYNLNVTVQPTHCGSVLEDFENIRFTNYGFIHGTLTEKVNNPGSNTQNTSPFCGQYVRNPSETYDVIVVDNVAVGNADELKQGIRRLLMDVRSNGSGRNIEITLENSTVVTPTNYPTGRHSTYRATTGAVNTWETLEFSHILTPDASVNGNSVDRIVILFMPNTNNNNTFYFDNIMIDSKPKTSTIAGLSTVCEGATGVSYSVTNTPGSSYNWSVPAGASIVSGATGPNNNSITVNYGLTSGNISVTETNSTGCSSLSSTTQAITVNNCSATGLLSKNTMEVTVFPNPSNGMLRLEYDISKHQHMNISIYNSIGQMVFSKTTTDQSIQLPEFSEGVYMIHITDQSEASYSQRLQIKK